MQQYLPIASMLPLPVKATFVVAFCCILFASMCIYICWWYWRFNCAYAKFPSERMEVTLLSKILLGRIPKNVTLTSVLFQELSQTAKRFQKEGFFIAWFFRPYLFVFNEDIMKRFYAEPAIANKSFLYNLMKEPLGKGLITSKEEKWKKDRKLLDPVFYVGALKRKISIFNDVAARLVAELDKRVGEPTSDVSGILKHYTFDVMAQSVLGLKLDDEKYRDKLVKYFNAVHEVSHGVIYRILHPWLYWRRALPFFSEGRKYLKGCDYGRSFTLEVLEEMKSSVIATIQPGADLDSGGGKTKSFSRILMEQHLKDPTFTMQEVLDHATTIVAAAHDTTSCTLLWCFYMLGLHPEIQDKAFKEIEVLTETDLTYDDICKLKYLECIIKETLRLYPTIPIYGRKLNKEIQWENYTIPNGTDFVVFLFQLHRRQDLYPDPEKFDPERFSGNSKVPPWGFTPFAEGYRSCIGKKFAMMEAKVLLAHLIRRFKIETLEKINASDMDWTVTLEPLKPLRFLLTLRQLSAEINKESHEKENRRCN